MHPCNSKGVGVLRNSTWYFSDRITNSWGNSLSPYWTARAIALLSGLSFQANLATSTWMANLTRYAAANKTRANLAVVEKLCSKNCTLMREGKRFKHLRFGHECTDAWTQIVDIIQADTRKALRPHFKGVVDPREWLLYDRPFANHPLQGYVDETNTDVVPCDARVIVIRCSGLCRHIQLRRIQHLRQKCSTVIVNTKNMSSREVDFSRLVFTPNVLVGTAGSTWALWSTLANTGNVYFPKFVYTAFNTNNIKVIDAPVYYTKEVAEHFHFQRDIQ